METAINDLKIPFYSKASIKTFLRPDYLEYFPILKPIDIYNRLSFLELPIATLLDIKNIEHSLKYFKTHKMFESYLDEPFIKKAEWLGKVMLNVGITKQVVDAILKVPREIFNPNSQLLKYSYINTSLFFSKYSCLSSPGIIALMLDQIANINFRDLKILEIGMGSGYHAACISEFGKNTSEIHGLEINEAYKNCGMKNIKDLGYSNVIFLNNKKSLKGTDQNYDLIYITASTNKIPSYLIDRLKEGGFIQFIRPINLQEFNSEPPSSLLKQRCITYKDYKDQMGANYQCLVLAKKENNKLIEINKVYDVQFVPYFSTFNQTKNDVPQNFKNIEKYLYL